MGKKHNTRQQPPGYNTYKTIMALRLASRPEGVTVVELAESAGCSYAAARFTLKHLVLAGEAARGDDDGNMKRYHSDVYAEVPPAAFIRRHVTQPLGVILVVLV